MTVDIHLLVVGALWIAFGVGFTLGALWKSGFK
jgi:hypothetical protein